MQEREREKERIIQTEALEQWLRVTMDRSALPGPAFRRPVSGSFLRRGGRIASAISSLEGE